MKYIDPYASSNTDVALIAGRDCAPKVYTKGGEYGRGTVVPSANPSNTDVIILNGVYVQFTTGSSDGTAAGTVGDPLLVNIKGSTTLTVDELVSVLNGTANTDIAVATYSNVSSGTFTIIYDTLADASSYTIDTDSLTAAPTSADTALSGGQAAVALSIDHKNIDIQITDSNDQYFTLADSEEFTEKTICLTAKSTGDAVITVASLDGSSDVAVTLGTAGQVYRLLFVDGEWKTMDDPDLSAITALAKTDGNFIVGNGSTWVAESGATARTSLGFTDPILDKDAPGTIGATTPNTGDFTDVTADTVTINAGGTFTADNGTVAATTGAATLSKMAGIVTSEALTTAVDATYTLTLTNTLVTANSNILVTTGLGTATTGTPQVLSVTPGSGSASIVIKNNDSTNAINGTILIQFMIVAP